MHVLYLASLLVRLRKLTLNSRYLCFCGTILVSTDSNLNNYSRQYKREGILRVLAPHEDDVRPAAAFPTVIQFADALLYTCTLIYMVPTTIQSWRTALR